jgi:hypothetical protein
MTAHTSDLDHQLYAEVCTHHVDKFAFQTTGEGDLKIVTADVWLGKQHVEASAHTADDAWAAAVALLADDQAAA